MLPTIAVVIMVLGGAAFFAHPVLGLLVTGGGYVLFQKASPQSRYDASATLWGLCLLAMIVVGLYALIQTVL